jgi:MoaA/NifB/PqqE/SkfB family radical SAM enzyme
MSTLILPEPVSGGLFLSYKCTNECRHCMYACSPKWKADWLPENDAETFLRELSTRIRPSPWGPDRVGVSWGLHFTGGEPFLNFDLLLRIVTMAADLKIPSTFVETNGHWCTGENETFEKLRQLREAGLRGLLVSVNPFILEHVPFERTERAVRVGRTVFGRNLMVYQDLFYHLFRNLGVADTLSFENLVSMVGRGILACAEWLPMGRLPYRFGRMFEKAPAKRFFDESCGEDLARDWHVHVDNYGNYMTGFCGGISMGDFREIGALCRGVDLRAHPVIEALTTKLERLFEIGRELGYREIPEGYIGKCHLCVDIRKHIVQQTDEFRELRPVEYYLHLE